MSDRRGLFKNADRDFSSSRRNRQDHSVEIRKVKKDDNLQKRRNIDVDDLSDTSPIKDKQKLVNTLSIFDICQMMKSSILSEKIEAVTTCRKLLSKQHNPPIEEFFIHGAVPILVKMMMDSKDETILFEAAWALTNIASGETKHTEAVVEAGAIKIFLALMDHETEHISEQSVWALSNIAGDSGKDRDLIVQQGVIPIIIRTISRFWNNAAIIRHLAWFVSNICRHKSENYPSASIIELLPYIHKMMFLKDDSQIHVDLSWGLSYASDNKSEIIDHIIFHKFLPLVNDNMSKSNEIIAPSIRLMGNIIAGTDEQANAAIEVGVIESMKALLHTKNPRIVKECCWLLSNVSAGTEEQVMALVNSGVVLDVLLVLEEGDYKSQKEAVWVVSNMITCKLDQPKMYLLNNNIFNRIVPLLSCDDAKTVVLLLDSIKALFVSADAYNQLEQCIQLFETAGGIDVVEELQNHASEEVYKISFELVKDYFGAEEEEEATQDNVQEFRF